MNSHLVDDLPKLKVDASIVPTLLPCGECGGMDLYLPTQLREGRFFQVSCCRCGASGPWAKDRKEAAERWNQRRSHWTGEYWPEEGKFCDKFYDECMEIAATHWMPLPTPPIPLPTASTNHHSRDENVALSVRLHAIQSLLGKIIDTPSDWD
ncbi:MAG: Lar family restriction alleviation protein, partial [Roseimicrobium sp.]